MKGWIPAHRSLFERDDWLAPSEDDPANNGYAWLWLCQRASHQGMPWKGVRLGRGEVMISARLMGRCMGWSKSKANRFLLKCVAEGMLEKRHAKMAGKCGTLSGTLSGTPCGTPSGTVYRIVSYDTYAVPGDTLRDTERDTLRDGGGTPAGQEQQWRMNKAASPRVRAREGEQQIDTEKTVRSLYGYSGSEGTDPILSKAFTDPAERDRCLDIALARHSGEELNYNGRQFRQILRTVIAEQSDSSSGGSKSDRIFDVELSG